MYYQYFGLKEAPFSIAPNPSYLLMTPRHQEALAHLYHGIKGDAGFVLLTGDIGTGKTTVCRHFLNNLPESTRIAFIINPCLDKLELLQAICTELGIKHIAPDASLKELTDSIYQCLLESHAKGINTVLLIDEAQQLYQDALELIRLLTNLETDTQKLLKIILVGQPELNQVLARHELEQLSQRITARYHIKPLSIQELTRYIEHRLQFAGYNTTNVLFPPDVIQTLYQMTDGVPRLINVVCDRALLGAYSQSCSQVTVSILRNAYFEVRGNYHGDAGYKKNTIMSWWLFGGLGGGVNRIVMAAAVLVLVGIFVFPVLFSSSPLSSLASLDNQSERLLETQTESKPEYTQPISQEPPVEQKREELTVLAEVTTLASSDQRVVDRPPVQSQQELMVIDTPKVELAIANGVKLIEEDVVDSNPVDEVSPPINLPTYYAEKNTAIEALFRRLTSATPDQACTDDNQTLARVTNDPSSEWRCVDSAVFNWQQFVEYNRPAVIRVQKGGVDYYISVLSVDDNYARVIAGEGVAKISLIELGQDWSGEFSYLWQAPVGFYRFVHRNSKAALVRGLAKKFSRIDGQKTLLATNRYNNLLKQRILLFQRQHQLKEDGKAGTATLLKINEVLKVAMTLDPPSEPLSSSSLK